MRIIEANAKLFCIVLLASLAFNFTGPLQFRASFVKADGATSLPLRVLIVKSQTPNPYPAYTAFYWLNQIYKIPCDLVNQTDVTNSTLYNSYGSSKYCCVIWTASYYARACGLAMVNWSGVIPQLLTFVLGSTPDPAISDRIFGAHWKNTVTVPANAIHRFFSNAITEGCSNYTGLAEWPTTIDNLTLSDGSLLWQVNNDIFLGAAKGKNVIMGALNQLLRTPDYISIDCPYIFTILFNFLKVAMGFVPIILPSEVLANVRVDDVFGKMPIGSVPPYSSSYISQFISDIKANNATASLGYVVANQTLVIGDAGKVLLNQTGTPTVDNWVDSINSIVRGNLSQNGGNLFVFAHGYTHMVCNETVYINAEDPTNSAYGSEWYDSKESRTIPYATQYQQMSKIYPVIQQWFNLTKKPVFIPSQGLYSSDTSQAAYDLGYPYFGAYYDTYISDDSDYEMLGDTLTKTPQIRAGGLDTGVHPLASFPNETYPIFAKYGVPLVPYLHAGGDFIGWNSSLQLINSLGARWTSLEEIAEVYAKQVTLTPMDLMLNSNGVINGTITCDGSARKLFIDCADTSQNIASIDIIGANYTNTTLFSGKTIQIPSELPSGIYSVRITLTSPSRPRSVTAGVQAEDHFEYSVLYATSKSELFGADNFTVTVLNVTGSTVNYELVSYYQNGTTVNDTNYVNLSSGYAGQGSWVVVAANLNAGDLIYPNLSWTINDTVTMNGRQVNHLFVDDAYVNNSGQNAFVTIDAYCDKITGAAVNISMNATNASAPEETMGFSYTLIVSDIVPEFSSIALVATMTGLGACTVVMVHRKKKREPRLQRELRQFP
jgi:hypothetical protein